jgi:hypothetical protein
MREGELRGRPSMLAAPVPPFDVRPLLNDPETDDLAPVAAGAHKPSLNDWARTPQSGRSSAPFGTACTNLTPTQQGALSGAAIGAGIGAAGAAVTGGNPATGAAIGGALGGAAGAYKGCRDENRCR